MAQLDRAIRGAPARGTQPINDGVKQYISQSPFSDPGRQAHLFNDLPDAIAKICTLVHAIQRQAKDIDFDTLDLQSVHYLTGAEAWRAHRDGSISAEEFEGGVANLRNGLLLDLLEINKLETHRYRPLLMGDPARPPVSEDITVLDSIAEATIAAQDSFTALRALYDSDPRLQITCE